MKDKKPQKGKDANVNPATPTELNDLFKKIFGRSPEEIESLESILRNKRPQSFADLFGTRFPGTPHVEVISSLEDLEKAVGRKFPWRDKDKIASKEAEALKCLPQNIQEAHIKLASVWKDGSHVMIDKEALGINALSIAQDLHFVTSEDGTLVPNMTLKGVYSAALHEIGDDTIVALIPEMLGIEASLNEMLLAQKQRQLTYSSIENSTRFFKNLMNDIISVGCPDLQTNDVLSVKRNSAFTDSNGVEPEFVVLLNGTVQSDFPIENDVAREIFDIQEEISQKEKVAAQLRLDFESANVEIWVAETSLQDSICLISDHFKENQIPDSKLVAVALDSEGIPHLIVETSIDNTSCEIPSALKAKVAKKHLNGNAPLSEEKQKALGIDQQIAEIEAMKIKEAEILDNL